MQHALRFPIENVIKYLRKSREDVDHEKQTGENVLAGHRERLAERLNALGVSWTERAEIGSGDTIAARKVFQQVLNEDIPSGKYQGIAITEISRLGRGDMEDAGRIYKTIIQYNLYIITPNKIYDPKNSADLRQIRFELFLSREEFEMIRERLMGGRDRKARKGYAPNYLAILGLTSTRGKFTVIPEEVEQVEKVFRLRANGESYQKIADVMNEAGHITKRGTKWHQSTVKRILVNPHYIGKSNWKGQLMEAQHPPLIPLELWNRVQQEVNPQRTTNRTLPRDNRYLVELYCHMCGSRMYGDLHRNKIYYVCNGKRQTPKCKFTVKGDMVHDEIFIELQNFVNNPVLFKSLVDFRTKGLVDNKRDYETQLKRLKRDTQNKENFLRKLELDYEKGDLSPSLYSKHFDKVTNELEALIYQRDSFKEILGKSSLSADPPQMIIKKLKRFLNDWDMYPDKTKKALIRAFLPRIEIDRELDFYFERELPLTLDRSE